MASDHHPCTAFDQGYFGLTRYVLPSRGASSAFFFRFPVPFVDGFRFGSCGRRYTGSLVSITARLQSQ